MLYAIITIWIALVVAGCFYERVQAPIGQVGLVAQVRDTLAIFCVIVGVLTIAPIWLVYGLAYELLKGHE